MNHYTLHLLGVGVGYGMAHFTVFGDGYGAGRDYGYSR